MQYIVVQGLLNYDLKKEARDIAEKWMKINEEIYDQEGKMFEKYNVIEMKSGGGGEYPGQDGFGWTNAIYLKFH